MKNIKITYSSGQVKGEEDVFAPDDIDAALVGGVNQVDPYGYLEVIRQSVNTGTDSSKTIKVKGDDTEGEIELDGDDDEPQEELGVVTLVTFSQTGKFTGDGTYLADVTATIEAVKGATNYDVRFFKQP
jgi:hypothetical protein